MFLSVGMWKLLVAPLVEWMFANRVYSAKVVHYNKNQNFAAKKMGRKNR